MNFKHHIIVVAACYIWWGLNVFSLLALITTSISQLDHWDDQMLWILSHVLALLASLLSIFRVWKLTATHVAISLESTPPLLTILLFSWGLTTVCAFNSLRFHGGDVFEPPFMIMIFSVGLLFLACSLILLVECVRMVVAAVRADFYPYSADLQETKVVEDDGLERKMEAESIREQTRGDVVLE